MSWADQWTVLQGLVAPWRRFSLGVDVSMWEKVQSVSSCVAFPDHVRSGNV